MSEWWDVASFVSLLSGPFTGWGLQLYAVSVSSKVLTLVDDVHFSVLAATKLPTRCPDRMPGHITAGSHT